MGQRWRIRAILACAIFAIAGGAWPAAPIPSRADETARILANDASAYLNEYERRIGRPMRQWACRELERADGLTVFYPFSGPDLPAAVQLFPGADRYVMVSMQRAGSPPRLESFSKMEFEDYLAVFRKTWKFYGALGFFRTADLDAIANTAGRPIGVLAALMAFAVRLGFEIEAVEPIALELHGNRLLLLERTPETEDTWNSARLTLWKDAHKVIVDYVRVNLSDTSLASVPGARRWVERMATNPTLLKAASHLPQAADFSIFRDIVLANAPVIVQDESGIDYGALARTFDVRLYGRFTRPNPSFDRNLQGSLAAAYRKGAGVKPLAFRSGYEKDAGSGMQIATRVAHTAQAPRSCP